LITSVELRNFLSHSNTILEFDKGVTVFVGHNGAGKSSIIDAITFALFGHHTRKSNKGLIKRGRNQAYVKVTFDINEKQYLAERKIDLKGGLEAQFSEKADGSWMQIAAGERKQFGESMTSEIEKKIGLNYEKLKIASIVQQGELNSIIKAKPKEFKELLNAIIGIDKLDIAAKSMKIINKDFREKIREKFGYDDTHIEILTNDLEKYQEELNEAIPLKEELFTRKKQYEEEFASLQKKFEIEAPKIDKINHLESRKKELSSYAKHAIQELRHEIDEKEKIIHQCQECFKYVGMKIDLESKFYRADVEIKNIHKKIQELSNKKASLVEKQSLAAKLQLKDNKCPVCDSLVDKLNPLFQEKHLREEITLIEDQISVLEQSRELLNKKLNDISEKLQNTKSSEAILRSHSIKDQQELKKIQNELEVAKQNIRNAPLVITSGNLVEVSELDSHAKMLFNSISQLEEETKGFDEIEFANLKESIDSTQTALSQINQRLGGVTEKISKAENQIKMIKKTISELRIVRDYSKEINNIEENVFSRDGSVATSLRSWALGTISAKATEYLTLLNTKIHRIFLTEKTRDIEIMCYSNNEVLDIESLSGGEQVSVALALRLGMASLLGAQNLNLMILDEPTTHLDSEHRKALVGVLSQLSNLTNTRIPMQFIIISHDAEIFDDSTVEQIYKFETTHQESSVTVL
jgi:exonuclease SbcC